MNPVNDIPTAVSDASAAIQQHISLAVDGLIDSLPNPGRLSAEQRRAIIARYTAVLEGNFIYWMTGALLAVQSGEARAIILENLHDEVRDCHPGMLRRFAQAARAVPTDTDTLAVNPDLTQVRLFIGRLSAAPIVVTMAFFEGFIQKFMAYLADLAMAQGSSEFEYTDVHGVCDVEHSQELFRALDAELALEPVAVNSELFEGIGLLHSLIQTIVHGARSRAEQAA
jgi:hypothetical protein